MSIPARMFLLRRCRMRFRNPLAPIRTAAQLLQGKGLSDKQLSSAQSIIARQATRVRSPFVSRNARCASILKKVRVSVDELIGSAVEAAQSRIDAKRHTWAAASC